MHFLPEKLDDYVVAHSQKEPRIIATIKQRNLAKSFSSQNVKWPFSR